MGYIRNKMEYLNKKEKKAVLSLKRDLQKKLGNSLISLKIFGSKARGDFNQSSDIDLIVLAKYNNQKIRDIVYQVVNDIMLSDDLYLSVKILSLKEFEKINQIPTVFAQLLEKEAINV